MVDKATVPAFQIPGEIGTHGSTERQVTREFSQKELDSCLYGHFDHEATNNKSPSGSDALTGTRLS